MPREAEGCAMRGQAEQAKGRLIWIDSGYFFAGVVVVDNIVVRAAPIVKYMRGWSGDRVCAYARSKRWRYGGV